MAKEIKLKSGSRKRHESLYKAKFKTDDESWNEDFNEFLQHQLKLMRGNREDVEAVIEENIQWLDQILSDEGIPKEFVPDENTIHDLKPVALAALIANKELHEIHNLIPLGYNNSSEKVNNWQYMFLKLLHAIPKLLMVQEAIHESAILGHIARTRHISEKASESSSVKDKNIEKCRPQYQKIIETRPDFNDSDIARKLKPWLWESYRIDRSESTIRKWVRQLRKS